MGWVSGVELGVKGALAEVVSGGSVVVSSVDEGEVEVEGEVCGLGSGSVSSISIWDNPMPRATMASFLASTRCALTSLAAFFFEKRICRMASSMGLPAI